MKNTEKLRNIAIIAHVDHGKTTIVDGLLRSTGVFRENEAVKTRVMDSNDLERERGITILSKNTAINYNGYKINIIDTPGHADFGGEVERVLKMCDGVILVVDAFEGPMPQTKFVLRRAIELKLPAIICVNKVDRPDSRAIEVADETLELFLSLDADEKYFDSPIIYASAKQMKAGRNLDELKEDMTPLLDAVIEHIPAPKGSYDASFKLLISTIDYSEFVGRIGIGKVESGSIRIGDSAIICNALDETINKKIKITNIYEFESLKRVPVEEASVGAVVAVTGVEGIMVGDTIADPNFPEPIDFVKISEPTLSMRFLVNDSPFAGKSGKYVTSRHLRNRLFRELETDVSLRVEETDKTDEFKVSGRGELHLSVLIETMRREGYEFQVSKPEVLMKKSEDGKILEPIEHVTVDTDEEYSGSVIEKLGKRKGELTHMTTSSTGYTRLEFDIPARGLIGYRQQLLTDTKGTGVLNSEFLEYADYKGEIPKRQNGSLIASESGVASTYGLHSAQERGQLFVQPQDEIYEGQVVGENPKGLDIEVNVCKKKQQTNIRSSASDDALRLVSHKSMSLEQLMEFVEVDELIEITPDALRIRKKILDTNLRYKSKKKGK